MNFDYLAIQAGKVPVFDYYLPLIAKRYDFVKQKNPFFPIGDLKIEEVIAFLEKVKEDTYKNGWYNGEIELKFFPDATGHAVLKSSPLSLGFVDYINSRVKLICENRYHLSDQFPISCEADKYIAKRQEMLSRFASFWYSKLDLGHEPPPAMMSAFCSFFHLFDKSNISIEQQVLEKETIYSLPKETLEQYEKRYNVSIKPRHIAPKVEFFPDLIAEDKGEKASKTQISLLEKAPIQTKIEVIPAPAVFATEVVKQPQTEVKESVEEVRKTAQPLPEIVPVKKDKIEDLEAIKLPVKAVENVMLKFEKPQDRGDCFEARFADLLNFNVAGLGDVSERLLGVLNPFSTGTLSAVRFLQEQRKQGYKHWYLPQKTLDLLKNKDVFKLNGDIFESSKEIFETHSFSKEDFPVEEVKHDERVLPFAEQIKHDPNSEYRKVDVKLSIPSCYTKVNNEINFSLKTSAFNSSVKSYILFKGDGKYLMEAIEKFTAFKNYVPENKELLKVLFTGFLLGRQSVQMPLDKMLTLFPEGWEILFKKGYLNLDLLGEIYPKYAKRFSSFLKVNAKDFISFFFEGYGVKVHNFVTYTYGKKETDNVLKVYKLTDMYKKIPEEQLVRLGEPGEVIFGGVSVKLVSENNLEFIEASIPKKWFEGYKIQPFFTENVIFKV